MVLVREETYLVCFGLYLQHLMELTRPAVKVIGRGGSVEADNGKFYTHYTFKYMVQPKDHNRTTEGVSHCSDASGIS